ncbi:MAG: CDP-diacylglycerol--glycerol-3-phosphate 3-phosphatidyltransferase, partial [Actinobacteria bacterium]|nr:CDP-diacylglycerol--glycerol-3-phosphate 3-phosphatidyltransferase [Actinomycetota bacterium]
ITTAFGEWADPLADKLLIGAALVVLVDLRAFPLWAGLVIAAREIVVQVLRGVIVNRGGALPASAAGKLKTILQIAMVGWWLAPWERMNAMHWLSLAAVVIVTLWSGVEYVLGYARTEEVTT